MRAYFDDRPVEVACDILGVSQDAARDQMRAFEAAGYVEPGTLAHGAGDDWWATTVKGNALANASFGKPISRATATRLLGQVIERARAYNADPARLLTVTEIVVFGSYLDPAVDPLGDLDLAVSTARRDTDGKRYVDKVLEYARASGHSFSTFHDRLFWPARGLGTEDNPVFADMHDASVGGLPRARDDARALAPRSPARAGKANAQSGAWKLCRPRPHHHGHVALPNPARAADPIRGGTALPICLPDRQCVGRGRAAVHAAARPRTSATPSCRPWP